VEEEIVKDAVKVEKAIVKDVVSGLKMCMMLAGQTGQIIQY
jgi:hypothetical protein